MKINKRIFWFSLLGVGITSLVPTITFTNSYTNADNNITQKQSDYDLVKKISNKYQIDSSIVYSQEQAISMAKKMDNSEINFLNNFVKNQEIYFHNSLNNEIIVEKDFYTNWDFL